MEHVIEYIERKFDTDAITICYLYYNRTMS